MKNIDIKRWIGGPFFVIIVPLC